MKRVSISCFLALALAGPLGGCGGTNERQPARQEPPVPPIAPQQRAVLRTIDDLQTASRRSDGGRICSQLFTPRLAQSVKAERRRPCPKAVGEVLPPKSTFSVRQGIRITGARAMATIVDQSGKTSAL